MEARSAPAEEKYYKLLVDIAEKCGDVDRIVAVDANDTSMYVSFYEITKSGEFGKKWKNFNYNRNISQVLDNIEKEIGIRPIINVYQ